MPVAAPPLSFFAAVRCPSARARGAPPLIPSQIPPYRTKRFIAKPSRLLARSAGRGSPPKTEPLAPDLKFPGPLGAGPAVLGSGATRSRRPRARARGCRNWPGFFRLPARAPARGSRLVLAPEPRTAGPGPGRLGADLKSAISGPPNAWFGGESNTNSVDGDVAHHANANCRLRTAGWGGGKSPKAKRCLSPEKTRLLSR